MFKHIFKLSVLMNCQIPHQSSRSFFQTILYQEVIQKKDVVPIVKKGTKTTKKITCLCQFQSHIKCSKTSLHATSRDTGITTDAHHGLRKLSSCETQRITLHYIVKSVDDEGHNKSYCEISLWSWTRCYTVADSQIAYYYGKQDQIHNWIFDFLHARPS